MYDIYRLAKELRLSEYETASALYRQITDCGFTGEKAVALMYRAGIVDGRKVEREKGDRAEYYKALYQNVNSQRKTLEKASEAPQPDTSDNTDESEVTSNV